ncbi:MAG: hypothetical protein AAGJ40_09690 [Planctomycetota bacterium]
MPVRTYTQLRTQACFPANDPVKSRDFYINVVDTFEANIGGVSAGGIVDGDKGDVVVSGGGATWTIDAVSVDTGKIADDAITLGKLAHGTANTVIGFDGTGQPAEITISSGVDSGTAFPVAVPPNNLFHIEGAGPVGGLYRHDGTSWVQI